MKKKRILIVALLAAIIGTAIYLFVHWEQRRPETTLKISGNIEAHESVVGFKVQGRLATLPVEEGQEVKAGDLLAKLDQNDWQQVSIDEATVRSREDQLRLSLAGSRVQEKKSAQQALLDAKADLELKKSDLQRYQALFEKDEVSAQLRDTAATDLKRAWATFERARENQDQVDEGTRKEQIAIDRANVHAARQALELSRIKLGYTVLTAPASGVVQNPNHELKPGMPADATLETQPQGAR